MPVQEANNPATLPSAASPQADLSIEDQAINRRQEKDQARQLTDKAVGGAGWLTLSALATKLIALVAMVVLGWWLNEKQFGLFATVAAVQALFGVVQVFGLRDLLTQQYDRIEENMNPAFWLSLTLGVATTLGMVALAFPLGRVFGAPEDGGTEFAWLMILFSLRCLIESTQNVSQAMLQLQLRFREIAIMNAVVSLAQSAVVLALAFLGFGAASMLIAILTSATLASVISWCLAKPKVKWRLEIRQWPRFFQAGIYLAGTAFVSSVIANGDYMALSKLAGLAVVGVYFFAFNQAVQSNVLFVGSVTSVMFSTLSRLGDSADQQRRMAMTSLAPLAMVSVPINFIQASAAIPLFHLIFPTHIHSIEPFMILSIAMVMSMIGAPSAALMRAQGRFAFFFKWNAIQAAIFISEMFLAAYVGTLIGHPAEAVALMVLIHYTIFGVMGMRLACGTLPGFWTTMARSCLLPMLMAVLGAVVAYRLLDLLPQTLSHSMLFVLFFICGVNLLVYMIGVRLSMPGDWNVVCERGLALYRKRKKRALVSYPPGV